MFFNENFLSAYLDCRVAVDYQLGLYADHRGFACAIVGLNEESQMGFASQVYSDKCSTKLMTEAINNLHKKYRFYRTNINHLPSLEEILRNNALFPNPINIDISDALFKITVLVNDGRLQIEESLKDTFEADATNFHPDIVCHRLNALALALAGLEDSNWLNKLVS